MLSIAQREANALLITDLPITSEKVTDTSALVQYYHPEDGIREDWAWIDFLWSKSNSTELHR
jgi:hypothetical protein